MSNTISICIVCAWRATCQKKFSISGRDMRCSDFVRDITISEEEKKDKGGEKDQKKRASE